MVDRPRRADESPVAYGLRTRRFGVSRGEFWISEFRRDPVGTTRAIEAMTPAPAGVELGSAVESAAAEFDRLFPPEPGLAGVDAEFAGLYPPPVGSPSPGAVRAAEIERLSDEDLYGVIFGSGPDGV